jgi:ABC-type glycerol-3-phosphate transport system substrate-binding protein
MLRKMLLPMAMACMVVVAGFGAGSRESQEKPVTIRIITRWSDQSLFSRAFQDSLKTFMAENPGIIVEDLSVNDENSFNEKIKIMIATGDVPEIVQNYGGAYNKLYFKSGVYADLASYLEKDNVWKNGFLPFFEAWTYDDLPGTWGVPIEMYAISLFYNKEIFKTLKLDPPETVEDLIRISPILKQAGFIPMATGVADNFRGSHLFTSLLVKKYGSKIVSDLANRKTTYEDPAIVDILTLMKDMQTQGVFGDNMSAVSYAIDTSLFASGKSAMHFDGSWYLGDQGIASIKAGAVPFPYFSKVPANKSNAMGGSGAGLSVAAISDPAKLEAAIKLVKYLTTAERFSYYRDMVGGGVYPVILPPSDKINSVTLEYADSYKNVGTFIQDVGQYDPLPQMLDITRNAIQGMLAGVSTPAQAARQMAAEQSR